MSLSRNIMGMNARNYLFVKEYNNRAKIRLADDKLQTKEVLLKHKIPTPKIAATFLSRDDVRNFNWKLPKDGFVIKPARGFGGEGIIPFGSWNGRVATSLSGEVYNRDQLQTHVLDILEGSFSLQYSPDNAFIEHLVRPNTFLRKLAPLGLPDIRLIVFHRIPVMAMMRVPTEESRGKANLHQGAFAVGLDMRTGQGVYGVHHNKLIETIPGKKTKISEIKIPGWDEILLIAAKTQAAVGLGYTGVDVVLDESLGPAILEVNARPGLAIQVANQTSLRTRLERVLDINVPTPERGVEISKSLFSNTTRELHKGPKLLSFIQSVKIVSDGVSKKVEAKLDTGAYRTSIDRKLARELKLKFSKDTITVKSASGLTDRKMVDFVFMLGGRKIKSHATIVDREHLKYPMIIGRQDMQGFAIIPERGEHEQDYDEDEETSI